MNILITGGTKGIGKATAIRFSEPGNNIFLNFAHDSESAQKAADEVKSKGASVQLLKYDIGNHCEVKEMINQVCGAVNRIDLIVHCAVASVTGNALEISPTDWRKAIDVSSLSLVDVVRGAKPLLGYGSSIIALSSRGATNAIPRYAALGAPKALVECIVKYLAVELAPEGIRVNVVSAGPLETDALRSVFPESYGALLKAAEKANPSGRALTFDDVTNTIVFLASSQAQMIQGRVIFVDGGLFLK